MTKYEFVNPSIFETRDSFACRRIREDDWTYFSDAVADLLVGTTIDHAL